MDNANSNNREKKQNKTTPKPEYVDDSFLDDDFIEEDPWENTALTASKTEDQEEERKISTLSVPFNPKVQNAVVDPKVKWDKPSFFSSKLPRYQPIPKVHGNSLPTVKKEASEQSTPPQNNNGNLLPKSPLHYQSTPSRPLPARQQHTHLQPNVPLPGQPQPFAKTPQFSVPPKEEKNDTDHQASSAPTEDDQDEMYFPEPLNLDSPASNHRSLMDIIKEYKTLPSASCLIGICDDGLPVLMDLEDPSSGSVLILGDDVFANRAHLKALIHALCTTNTADQITIDLISNRADLLNIGALSHLLNIHSPFEASTYEALSNAFLLTQSREERPQDAPLQILVIDQLEIVLKEMSPSSKSFLRYLIRMGPAVGIWIVAALKTQANTLDAKTIRSFKTLLWGKVGSPLITKGFAGPPTETLTSLKPGEQACLMLNDKLLQYDILQV